MLYRNHPSLVHSDCCVVVKPSSAIVSRASVVFGEEEELEKDSRWIEVQAASRLCVQVNKVRSIQKFFTHRSVSTFDRVYFQLTGELFLYGTALRGWCSRRWTSREGTRTFWTRSA